jgi:hypothetical protein
VGVPSVVGQPGVGGEGAGVQARCGVIEVLNLAEAHRRSFNDFDNPFVLLSRVGEEGIDL